MKAKKQLLFQCLEGLLRQIYPKVSITTKKLTETEPSQVYRGEKLTSDDLYKLGYFDSSLSFFLPSIGEFTECMVLLVRWVYNDVSNQLDSRNSMPHFNFHIDCEKCCHR